MEPAHKHEHDQEHCEICACCELSELNLDFRETGTRFRLFPQSPLLTDYQQPETVWVSVNPADIGPGPSDDKMYVVDAIDKQFYEEPYLPPFDGNVNPPAMASDDGHFDHLEVGTHEFEAAHMYGTLRFVLDIWETYFNRDIKWSFSDTFERMELVPWVDWDNAHTGFGFIEAGYSKDDEGGKFPFNLNFDVLAHEFGHQILYSTIGMPTDDNATPQFFAFHETSGDIVAVISLLHFNSVLDRILQQSSGNLYARNELNRLGEESNTRQIRMASNDLKMENVPDPRTPVDQLSIKQLHDMSLPFTGALFDLLVEIFQQKLVEAGLIDEELDQLSRSKTEHLNNDDQVQELFDQAYLQNPEGFKKALVNARDYIGMLLSLSWEQLSWDLTFPQIVHSLLNADEQLSNGHYKIEISEVFDWREIKY